MSDSDSDDDILEVYDGSPTQNSSKKRKAPSTPPPPLNSRPARARARRGIQSILKQQAKERDCHLSDKSSGGESASEWSSSEEEEDDDEGYDHVEDEEEDEKDDDDEDEEEEWCSEYEDDDPRVDKEDVDEEDEEDEEEWSSENEIEDSKSSNDGPSKEKESKKKVSNKKRKLEPLDAPPKRRPDIIVRTGLGWIKCDKDKRRLSRVGGYSNRPAYHFDLGEWTDRALTHGFPALDGQEKFLFRPKSEYITIEKVQAAAPEVPRKYRFRSAVLKRDAYHYDFNSRTKNGCPESDLIAKFLCGHRYATKKLSNNNYGWLFTSEKLAILHLQLSILLLFGSKDMLQKFVFNAANKARNKLSKNQTVTKSGNHIVQLFLPGLSVSQAPTRDKKVDGSLQVNDRHALILLCTGKETYAGFLGYGEKEKRGIGHSFIRLGKFSW